MQTGDDSDIASREMIATSHNLDRDMCADPNTTRWEGGFRAESPELRQQRYVPVIRQQRLP